MHKTMSEMPGVGGVLHQISGREVRHAIKKLIQSDLTFCKNEGSIRSKTNEKGCQLDRKLRQKLIQNGKYLCKIYSDTSHTMYSKY